MFRVLLIESFGNVILTNAAQKVKKLEKKKVPEKVLEICRNDQNKELWKWKSNFSISLCNIIVSIFACCRLK